MSKKDYIKFAKMINERIQELYSDQNNDVPNIPSHISELQTISLRMLDIFSSDNPNFDRERFLEACGLS